MFGFTIIKTSQLESLRRDCRLFENMAEGFRRERNEALAELAPLKAAREKRLNNLRQGGKAKHPA